MKIHAPWKREIRRAVDPSLRQSSQQGWGGAVRVRGYLMIECFVYLALLTVITGFGFTAFYQCMTNSRDLSRSADGVVRALKVGERWRADLRAATADPKLLEEEDTVALEIPHADGLVVYVFYQQAIWRKTESGPAKKILADVSKSAMLEEDREQVKMWRWDLELKKNEGTVRFHPMFTFKAVVPQPIP